MAKSATAKRKQNSKPRPVQAPTRREQTTRPPVWLYVAAALGLVALVVAGVLVARGGGTDATSAAGSLPRTSDYHSLLVSPTNARELTLGTHQGLFRSVDGGRNWTRAELVDQDAMNLAQPSSRLVWAAGHNVLARSGDGGRSWTDVRPDGLPSLDVHGFAVDPRNEKRLFAAIAGQGMYRSSDGGRSFSLVNTEVGPGVMALAVLPDGRVLAGDMQREQLAVSSDAGITWKPQVDGQVMGIAVNPADAKRILLSGSGVSLSTDGGHSWDQTLTILKGSGPVAWSRSDPQVAYVVGFDRSLYRTEDGGTTWAPVVEGEGR
jgi:photosystem II stability/assembly factor-like uncharacterized protein